MSINITRPTSTTHRARFATLTAEQRAEVKALAVKGSSRAVSAKEAWDYAFARFDQDQSEVKRSSGVAGKTFQRAVGHRLVNLRAHSAECSCGKKSYKGDTASDIREAHAAHKAAKVPVVAEAA